MTWGEKSYPGHSNGTKPYLVNTGWLDENSGTLLHHLAEELELF